MTTLHTIIRQPHPTIRAALHLLCKHSSTVVVLARTGATLLAEEYQVDPGRIVIIPHGVPEMVPLPLEEAKRRLRLEGHTILTTFGLLHRNKGLEQVICALPAILKQHPDVLYLLVGQTHPQILRQEGEAYRDELAGLSQRLGVSRAVIFINQFLDQPRLLQYLQATDIYITPYLEAAQISSGTLSYALGCGRAIVSTPYLYAQEVLADGRGLLAAFSCPESLAGCVTRYLDDPAFAAQTRGRAATYGRQMTWPCVGARYAQLFGGHAVPELNSTLA